MPVVPFSRVEPRIDDSLMPSDTHLAMAAAMMRVEGLNAPTDQPTKVDELKVEEKKMEGRQRYQDSVNPEEQLGKIQQQYVSHYPKQLNRPDLNYAKPGDDWDVIINHNGKMIDPYKLSPKHLKELDVSNKLKQFLGK